ncbi:MAG: hypothetical protein ACFE7E_04220 [Candidatus Hodarchaeota archaeon]
MLLVVLAVIGVILFWLPTLLSNWIILIKGVYPSRSTRGQEQDFEYNRFKSIKHVMFSAFGLVRLVLGIIFMAIVPIFVLMMTIPLYSLLILSARAVIYGAGAIIYSIRIISRKSVIAIGILLIVSPIGFFGMYSQIQQVSNAYYFQNSFVVSQSGYLFDSQISPNLVRLITPELAWSIAEQRMAEFGSNMEVKSIHIAIRNSALVWVAAIGSTNILAENYIAGLIVINANDPTSSPEVLHTQFRIGENLFWTADSVFRSYLENPQFLYGRAYTTWHNDQPVLVQTRYEIGYDLITRAKGVIVYDTEGIKIGDYDADNIPSWITQPWDESWLVNHVSRWGDLKRDGDFDYWASGFLFFIAPSRDRVAISETPRFIVNPDTNDVNALIFVHPATSDRTLAGVFKATRSGIFYYDYRFENYISGITAEDLIEGKISQPAQGRYYSAMPMLYPLNISPSESRLVWYVPLYWQEGGYFEGEFIRGNTIIFAGLGLVDAKDISYILLNTDIEGMNGEEVVTATQNEFIALFSSATNVTLALTVNNVSSYELDGDTHIVLGTNNTQYPYIEGTAEDLVPTEWYELLQTTPGDTVIVTIIKIGEVWRIIQFDNQDI